jgi:hypothetical protein
VTSGGEQLTLLNLQVSFAQNDTEIERTYEYMLSCRTKLCQLLCLKNRGRTILVISQVQQKKKNTVMNYLANSVGLGQVNIEPSCDHWINPVRAISSSSNIAYSFPTNAACVLSGGLTNG